MLNGNPRYGKFIQVYTFYYLIHSYWVYPRQFPAKELYSKTPNALAQPAFCNDIEMSSYSNSIDQKEKVLTEKNLQIVIFFSHGVRNLTEYYCGRSGKKSIDIISLYNSLSDQKDGSSEKQSITNFFPMYFHDKRGINVESDMREESMMITNKNYYQEEEKWKKS